jgi:hypothetical protein
MVKFYTENGQKPLPYDPWTTHAIPAQDLEACAQKQKVTFRQGDILILRVGFTQKWYTVSRQEREALSGRPETLYSPVSYVVMLMLLTIVTAPVSSSPKT